MTERTYPVWAIVLVVGFATSFLLGYFNPIVSQKQIDSCSKRGESVPIYYRYNKILYMMYPYLVAILFTVIFVKDSFANTIIWFGDGVKGMISGSAAILIVDFVMVLIMIVMPMLAERIRIERIRSRIYKKYGLYIIDNNDW